MKNEELDVKAFFRKSEYNLYNKAQLGTHTGKLVTRKIKMQKKLYLCESLCALCQTLCHLRHHSRN